MAEKIKIGIVGYGNLGKGVEAAVNTSPDMRLVNVFTRREPERVMIRTAEAEVLAAELLEQTEARFEKPDVLIVCGGSAGGLPWQSPRYAKKYNIVDSFDNHAKIYAHFQNVDAQAKEGGRLAIIAAGWDPGLFSLNRMLAEALLPEGKTYTLWGRGISQGHSDAIRSLEGVTDARQYTIPKADILEKIRAGEKLSASDYKTLGNMYALNKKILEELSALSEELTDKDMAAFMKDKAGNKVYEHFRNIENFAIEGGFASETDNAPAVTEKKEANVSSAQAEESCRGYFADYDIASCEYAGETVSGEIDGYNFTLTDGDGRMLYAVIAKANGALVGFDYYADCTKKNVDFENALAIAENYVKSLGYDNMTAVWASESGVNATFTFVYEQDGVAYYPDALRVKVCEERGKAVGFTAVSFLNNHKDRAQEKTPACKVSEEKAEKTLNSCLNVLNARRAVIRFGDKEKLCYEFACAHGEDGYFVYVDAATGEEVKINRVVPTAQGRYLR